MLVALLLGHYRRTPSAFAALAFLFLGLGGLHRASDSLNEKTRMGERWTDRDVGGDHQRVHCAVFEARKIQLEVKRVRTFPPRDHGGVILSE
ncbi:hypothetical protein B0H16DRAFT_590493 [Mycena metata]|uniref:Uncharacterized protein n=1 Tax=Mycena metata TaxID=1033252 RepID=A0AAD7H461_9AGAR|nr:hypothetical protein B0H16DRAFT_590493 [Mycena metata]